MPFVKGQAIKSNFITAIVDHLTSIPVGGTEPYWKRVQTGLFANEGIILHSKGSSGEDDIYIQIKQGAASNLACTVRMLYNYQPNMADGIDGTYENAMPEDQLMIWYADTYPSYTPIYYSISFDKDRIMIWVQAEKGFAGSDAYASFMWMGLPQRLNAMDDSTSVAHANSNFAHELTQAGYGNGAYGNYAKCTTMRSRTKNWNPTSSMISMTSFRSMGWNKKLLLPDIFLDDGTGVRSKMHGIHPLVQSDPKTFEHGDEITVGSKRYTILNIWRSANYSHNCFPSAWIAVEQLQ